MITINRKYSFILYSEKGKSDQRLRMRIKWDNSKNVIQLNVGYMVDPNKWSSETSRCKNNTTHGTKKIPSHIINRVIQNFEETADQIFTESERSGTIISKEEFKYKFNELTGKKNKEPLKGDDFLKVFDKFVTESSRASNWTKGTIQKFDQLRYKLKKFKPEADFEYFTEEGLNEFVIFLRDDLNLKNSTTIKQVSFLRWFLRWAEKKGYNTNRDYQFFKPKLKGGSKRVIFLNFEELKQIEFCEIPEEKLYLHRVRDVFLFQCFTGLRHSDVFNLKRSDVKESHIEITTIKTADSLIIDLNTHSKAILDKYKDTMFEDDKVLPVISNQKMNEYLKELAMLAGIDEEIRETTYKGKQRIDTVLPKYHLIGTHTGRRSFICNALALGISPQVVMKWTGHSDYKSMQPYIEVADQTKKSAMSLFDK